LLKTVTRFFKIKSFSGQFSIPAGARRKPALSGSTNQDMPDFEPTLGFSAGESLPSL